MGIRRQVNEMRVATFHVVDKTRCVRANNLGYWSEELDCLQPDSSIQLLSQVILTKVKIIVDNQNLNQSLIEIFFVILGRPRGSCSSMWKSTSNCYIHCSKHQSNCFFEN